MKLLLLIAAILTPFTTLYGESSVGDQIGQLLIPYVDGRDANEETFEFLRTYRPGGIILYNWSNGLTSPEQVKALTTGLQKQASELALPPLFIATDQEGGPVTRLRNGFTEFPENAALGRANSTKLVYDNAKQMGREMLEVGVNFTFAPVVDVNSNPNNPVIGIRSYGDSPELVSRLGLAATRGFSDAGLFCCLKHFPGHGDTAIDSHDSLPVLDKTRDALDQVELVPFRTILNNAPAIMTAHIRLPKLDRACCATLSKPILTGLLRDELGYKGLIITDSLTMGAILEECGDLGEAAVRAFEAGCDLLLIGGRTLNNSSESVHEKDLVSVRSALLTAIQEGRISEERLRASLDRIRSFKEKLQIEKA
jgi:beta-N-acetylhexosaminidase